MRLFSKDFEIEVWQKLKESQYFVMKLIEILWINKANDLRTKDGTDVSNSEEPGEDVGKSFTDQTDPEFLLEFILHQWN